jgi:hypothetical protein
MASEHQLLYSPRRPRPWVLIIAQITLLAILVSCLKPLIALAIIDAPSRDYVMPISQLVRQANPLGLSPRRHILQYSQRQAIAPPEIEQLSH